MESKWLFKCPVCKTVMTLVLTELNPKNVHEKPLCICGKSKMVNMSSDEYAYGNF